jgi:hypothetical protein
MSPVAFALPRGLEHRRAISNWSRAVEYFIAMVRARLGGTSQNVVPASDLILERFDEPLEHSGDVVVVHRRTSVIAFLTFR